MIKDKCSLCKHNLNKSGLDCEFYCAGATKTREDEDGVVYVVQCEDYEKDRKVRRT